METHWEAKTRSNIFLQKIIIWAKEIYSFFSHIKWGRHMLIMTLTYSVFLIILLSELIYVIVYSTKLTVILMSGLKWMDINTKIYILWFFIQTQVTRYKNNGYLFSFSNRLRVYAVYRWCIQKNLESIWRIWSIT